MFEDEENNKQDTDNTENVSGEEATENSVESSSDAASDDKGEDLADEWAAALEEGENNKSSPTEGTENADDIESEWASAMDDVQSEKSLDQDAINALFETSGTAETNTGPDVPLNLTSILDSSHIYAERLPILDVVFDRLVRLLSTTLRNFTGDNVDISFSRIKSMRFGDFLNGIPLPTMIGVFRAVQWDNYAMIVIESKLVYAIVDMLLGGRKNPTADTKLDGRPHTTIERNLIEKMIEVILLDFSEAFAPISRIDFEFERLEINPRFAAVAREKNGIMVVTMKMEMEERFGKFDIILPYATVEPIRDILLQNFMGEKFGRDNIWEGHLADRIWDADITIEASLREEELSLGKVMQWKKGSQLMLSSDMQSPITLSCQNYKLAEGRMGQKNNRIALKINNILFGKNGG